MKIDIIILSNTINDRIWNLNIDCINSLIKSEKQDLLGDIIIVESCNKTTYKYPEKVKVILPGESFNYNRFLNIGIQATNSEFIGLCNNDLFFHENWFSEILKVKNKYADIYSFSPIDIYNQSLEPERYISYGDFYLGYNIRSEIAGWCIVIERTLLSIIGSLDERFDFYYSDNDYSMTLRKYAIKHALVTKSIVSHLGGVNSKEVKKDVINENTFTNGYLPNDLKRTENQWILQDPKMLEGYFKFHMKWGGNLSLRYRRVLQKRLPILKAAFISRILYSTCLNFFFSISIRWTKLRLNNTRCR